MPFSDLELAELRLADAEIDRAFEAGGLTAAERRLSAELDREATNATPPSVLSQKADYYHRNREAILAKRRETRARTKEKRSAWFKTYYAAHREEIVERNKANHARKRGKEARRDERPDPDR